MSIVRKLGLTLNGLVYLGLVLVSATAHAGVIAIIRSALSL